MAEAFRGEFNQKVDAKARVSVPASFRRVIEAGDPKYAGGKSSFVLVYGGNRDFVECYTMTEMKRVEDQVRALKAGTPARKYLERNMMTLSLNMEVDEDGRIVLPQKAREKLGISPDDLKTGLEAVFAGVLDRFRIWKDATYAAELEAEDPDLLPPGEDMLSLLPDLEG